MTVAEFSQLPDPPGGGFYELHYGEVVPLTFPRYKHYRMQSWLRDLLRPFAPFGCLLEIECAFRALPEYDMRSADVACLSPERASVIDPEGWISGAPELVIEILSPSNTASEMFDKEQLCLANGCQEFWVVDPKRRYVRIAQANGLTTTYHPGQQIPLTIFHRPDLTLGVDQIFAGSGSDTKS